MGEFCSLIILGITRRSSLWLLDLGLSMPRPQDSHNELFPSLGKSVQSVGSLETYNGQNCVAHTNLTPTGFNSLGASLKFAVHQNREIAQHTISP